MLLTTKVFLLIWLMGVLKLAWSSILQAIMLLNCALDINHSNSKSIDNFDRFR